MVGVDDQHKQSFAELNRRNPRVIYYVFDLLELDNEPVIDLTLRQRRRKLDKLFVQQPRVWLSPMFSERDIITNAAHAHDFEGVVAKRLSSKYQPGKRSRDWQKLRFADYPTGFSRR
jgi:bifunctional non-homologous end joining protein LigD